MRIYLAGHCVSLVGTWWVQRVARDWLMLEITDRGTAHSYADPYDDELVRAPKLAAELR
jgi:hypothetical protein